MRSSRRVAATASSPGSCSSAPRRRRSTCPTSWPSSAPRAAPRPPPSPTATACSTPDESGPALYQANKKSDRDKDKIACEKK
ncbi:MAG: hypothetical protein EON52_04550 [Actinomycetales bacterium]|nr:MAG: hypothetical protein EON52_04550 [Actinomycetales bacterium]